MNMKCPVCGGEYGAYMKGAYKSKYFDNKTNTMRPIWFCSEQCYKDYTEKFIVETYNDKSIYCMEVNGEKRYMPYFEADYYFTNIDDCKKRMDMKVAVIHDSVLRYGFANYF